MNPVERVIGRSDERAAVHSFLGAGGPAALLIEGDAGIGKTTLWRAGVDEARRLGARVLACTAAQAETELAYAGLNDLLEPVLDHVLPALPDPQRTALRIALLRQEAGGIVTDRLAVSVAALGVLRELASRSAVLVAIDDLQWLDAATADALRFALRRLDGAPVSLLASVRAGEAGDARLELAASPALERLERVSVGPLAVDELDRVLRLRLGAPFLRPTLLTIHDACAGNPFFAIELGRALLSRRSPLEPGEPLPVPAALRELLARRVAGLSARCRDALVAAAALADPQLALLERALGAPVSKRLAPAVEAELIDIADDRVRFAHPLLAAAVYSTAPAEDRRRIHRRLAGAVEQEEERARHLGLAAEGADVAAAEALDRAAAGALGRGAPATAAELLEQARRLTPGEDVGELHRRMLAAADCHLTAGDTARARVLLEEVARDAPRGDVRARALHRIARVRGREESHDAAVRLLGQALDEATDGRLIAAIEVDLAATLLQSGDLRRAGSHVRRAVATADAAGAAAVLAEALTSAAMLELLLGNGMRADLIERAVALARQPGESRLLPPELAWGTMLKWTDEFAGARSKLASLRERALEQHEDGWLPYICFQLGELECWSGDLAAAASCVEECRRATRQTGNPAAEVLTLYLEGLVAAHLGDIETARDTAAAGAEIAIRTADLRAEIRCLGVEGFVALSLGDAAQACRRLDRASALAEAAGYRDPAVLRLAADTIEARIGAGRLDEAASLLAVLEERGTTLDRPWALATAARCRGLLEATRGDLPAAVAALERALEAHDRLPQPIELARTLLALGTVERRRKQKRSARAWLGQALEAFERLGAEPWAERTRGELARIGGRAPAPDAITPTEERVIALVVQGYTNREVAQELFVSPKTVEAHLGHIYRKLGASSRRELARLVGARP